MLFKDGVEAAGMPPQIVGGDEQTFVIGDDEADLEEDGFEYVHDVEIAPSPSNSSSPEGLRNTGQGSPRGSDKWDQGGAPVFAGPVE